MGGSPIKRFSLMSSPCQAARYIYLAHIIASSLKKGQNPRQQDTLPQDKMYFRLTVHPYPSSVVIKDLKDDR